MALTADVLQELKDAHAATLAEFKAYFNETTSNNLNSIASLKQEMEEVRRREEQAQATAQDVTKKIGRMAEALAQVIVCFMACISFQLSSSSPHRLRSSLPRCGPARRPR